MTEQPATDRITYFRYARLNQVDDFLSQGWVPDGLGPLHAPHGAYSVVLVWPGPGEPPSEPLIELARH